ncbi:HdeD family acid-resistance protein [Cryobacterium sp. W22_MBD10_FK3]|uniref:HdeD family acid-resistance protein n=1 Tax=Cryobacterium sp. W22_MBD10_FK3 TaxID=3240273 RepID=UPI003F8F24FF
MPTTSGPTSAVFAIAIDPRQLTQREVSGIRAAFAVSAVVAITVGTMLLVWTEATLTVIAVLFGLYFVISGVVRIVRGVASTRSAAGGRVLNIVLGVIVLILGILAIRNPEGSLAVLGLLVGIVWIVEGVAALVEYTTDSSRWPGILLGVVGVLAGVIVLFAPVQTIGVLVTIGGIMLIVSGLVQLVRAFTFGRGLAAG